MKTKSSKQFCLIANVVETACGVRPQVIDWVKDFYIEVFRRYDLGILIFVTERRIQWWQKTRFVHFGSISSLTAAATKPLITEIMERVGDRAVYFTCGQRTNDVPTAWDVYETLTYVADQNPVYSQTWTPHKG